MGTLIFFTSSKGGVALYAILKAIGINEGDEIILPGFTCVVVSNSIIYLGARPENLYGIDLLEDRIEQAKYLSPII